jgi:hypothetical protein
VAQKRRKMRERKYKETRIMNEVKAASKHETAARKRNRKRRNENNVNNENVQWRNGKIWNVKENKRRGIIEMKSNNEMKIM